MLFKYASQIGSMFVFLLVLFGEKIHSQWINNIIYFKYRILWFSVLDENASASFFCAKVFCFFFECEFEHVFEEFTDAVTVQHLAGRGCFQRLRCLTNTIPCSFHDQWELF